MPSKHFLPRRHECTRVYTTVYPRVHYCIHACTQVRSKYLLSRARLYVCFLGIMPRIFSDRLKLPGVRSDTPEDPKAKGRSVRARSYVDPVSFVPQGCFPYYLKQCFSSTLGKDFCSLKQSFSAFPSPPYARTYRIYTSLSKSTLLG